MQCVSCRTMVKAMFLEAGCSMTETLFAVSPSVFSWSMLGRGSSSAAFLLPRPEKGVVWPTPRWTHPARVAVVALMVTDLVSLSRNAATGRSTWRHLSSSPPLMHARRRAVTLLCFGDTFRRSLLGVVDETAENQRNKNNRQKKNLSWLSNSLEASVSLTWHHVTRYRVISTYPSNWVLPSQPG